jgi:valyl-tRNA synthetase
MEQTEPKLKEKTWSKELEKPIFDKWKAEGTYKFVFDSKKPTYSIDTPPPYVNSPVHIGQVTTYCCMDMFARFKRMTGHNILFPLGLDRNGLPIEMAAEKKFGVKLTETPREKFIELCSKVLEESSLASMESFLRCGIGFNSWKVGTEIGEIYETDSPDYRALTQGTFIDMWKKNLIYEDTRINNFCPGCQTTLADAEVIYQDLPSTFNDIVFTVKETGEKLDIGTTRPELVCTCGMVIFNPNDERYKHLEGKTALTPIFEKAVPIKAHPLADEEKGTGLAMMCSAGDLSDIRFFREMSLEPVIAINKDGTMNENAGFLKGQRVVVARKLMIEELKKRGLLVKQQHVTHRTPICERSKDPIEFISMSEFYVKQVERKDEMRKLVNRINFFAPESKQIMLDWIDAVSIDWPISRRRFYATEVPLWYCEKCGEIIVPEKGKYYQPWKQSPPVASCPKCKGTKFRGEERVFDTWFDSSITPLYILKYDKNPEFFEKNSPCSLRPQGKEIIRTWLYYTVLKDYLLTGKCIFKDVWINYHIVDGKGFKMSKSKGNVIDPKEVLDKYGAEPFRLWAAVEGNLTSTDFKCSFERIDGAAKTLTKLWNVAKFISMMPEPKGKIELTEADRWIITEMNRIIRLANDGYSAYDFHGPVLEIKTFIWDTFSSHYLEMVKNRAYNENNVYGVEKQMGALHTLNYCLDQILKLLAPVLPLITYRIYSELRGKDIHFEDFPKTIDESKIEFTTSELADLNSRIWKAKKDAGLSLKGEVKELKVPAKFKALESDLKSMHKINNITYIDGIEIIL